MRIRSTKPEFWRSQRIASVDWDARLVLKALESHVDDNGVGEDDVNTLAGDCFLFDLIREPSRTLARVSEAISQLEQAGLVWLYEDNGRNLVYVSFWESVQRIDKPQPGRNPRPDGTMNYKESIIRESLATPREPSRSLAPGTGEQGNRGTEEQGNETHLVLNVSTDRARELSTEEIGQLQSIFETELSITLDSLAVLTVAEFITEASTSPVDDPMAYIVASIRRSPKRVGLLCAEAIRQSERVKAG